MQINRLFEMVYLLLQREQMTAKELAERFLVSTRTVYRDLDALSAAGIPVYADRGRNGGIRLLEGFALNKALFSDDEQREILSALQGMRAASPPGADTALNKLSLLFRKQPPGWVDVDFSSWNGYDAQFTLLKEAIKEKRAVAFDYYSRAGGKTRRTVEPLQLWFKHRAWYLKSYCRERNDYRLFRYTRIKNIAPLNEFFTRELPQDDRFAAPNPDAPYIQIVLRIDAAQAYRAYDQFDESDLFALPNGDILATAFFLEDEWLYGFILGFLPYAEVIYPERIRGIIAEKIKKSAERYKI